MDAVLSIRVQSRFCMLPNHESATLLQLRVAFLEVAMERDLVMEPQVSSNLMYAMQFMQDTLSFPMQRKCTSIVLAT